MKTIRIAMCAVALAGFSVSCFADTYSWVNKDGQKMFSDRPPVGISYIVKVHAPPAPYSPVVVMQFPAQSTMVAFGGGGNPRVNDAYAADSASAIKARNRNQIKECLGIQQSISRMSSSRNFTVDPDTGGSMEERNIREAKELYGVICGA
jgi:hypothetical protein